MAPLSLIKKDEFRAVEVSQSKPSTMDPLPSTAAKSKRLGYLLRVKAKITALKEICNDPGGQEEDKIPTATTRLEEAWQKYQGCHQEALGLILEGEGVGG